jgi:pimeloyl-ACP methyl ester carboxylesterase
MHTIATRADPAKRARCLLVMLPGRGDSDEVFAEHGFIEDLRARKLSVDTVSANATLGYYAKQTIGDRLDADVIEPARLEGYEQIWFAGVSMGGLGSIIMARRHGPKLAGIILIAPFLFDDILDEIEAAGGLARWKPDPAATNYEQLTWKWLKNATETPSSSPSVYLASGDQDRLSRGHRLLGAALPPERRFRVRGGHDWGPWRKLWRDFLDRSDFAARCGTQ